MESQRDPELKRIHNDSGLTTPDGMPMVWAGRRAGATRMDRVYGPDLMLALAERAAAEGWRSFFYGGKDGVADTARRPAPGAATRAFSQRRHLLAALPAAHARRRTRPSSSASTPRAPSSCGSGCRRPSRSAGWPPTSAGCRPPRCSASAPPSTSTPGRSPQAPRWMQRRGLEWAYRLIREPRRLWRRYALQQPALHPGDQPGRRRGCAERLTGRSARSAGRSDVVVDDPGDGDAQPERSTRTRSRPSGSAGRRRSWR